MEGFNMEKLNIYYSKEFYKIYGKHAIMDPDTIKLGDIIDSDTLEVVGSLEDKGIVYTEKGKGKENADVERTYKSKNIKIGDLSSGQKDIAKFGFTFSSDHSLFLATKGSKIVGIAEDNLGKNNLGKQIIALYNKGKWQKNWIVVTEVEYAKKAIIILSHGKNAEIELKAQSPTPIGVGEIINAELSFGSESSIGFRHIMPEGDYRIVLFKAKGIDDAWFSKTKFVSKEYSADTKAVKYLKEFVWEK